MNKNPLSLPKLRKQIDQIDDQIVGLLNRRLRLAEKIGTLKAVNGHKVYDRSREKQVLERICKKKGVLTQRQLQLIYQSVLRASREQQRKLFGQKSH
jgi:chorismate mutase / prephenate dehydratase